MITIVDYGVGNIFSIKRSLDYIGADSFLTQDPEKVKSADRIILPGVGAFGDAAIKLRECGMDEAVCEAASKNVPLLGICLGMQLLFDKGLEYGEHKGLGLIPGVVEDMKKLVTGEDVLIPQMGWNSLDFPYNKPKSPIFKYVDDGSYVYFVHSYSAIQCEESIIATTDYTYPVTAAVSKENVYGVQFHPEKSGEVGLNILKAFAEL